MRIHTSHGLVEPAASESSIVKCPSTILSKSRGFFRHEKRVLLVLGSGVGDPESIDDEVARTEAGHDSVEWLESKTGDSLPLRDDKLALNSWDVRARENSPSGLTPPWLVDSLVLLAPPGTRGPALETPWNDEPAWSMLLVLVRTRWAQEPELLVLLLDSVLIVWCFCFSYIKLMSRVQW